MRYRWNFVGLALSIPVLVGACGEQASTKSDSYVLKLYESGDPALGGCENPQEICPLIYPPTGCQTVCLDDAPGLDVDDAVCVHQPGEDPETVTCTPGDSEGSVPPTSIPGGGGPTDEEPVDGCLAISDEATCSDTEGCVWVIPLLWALPSDETVQQVNGVCQPDPGLPDEEPVQCDPESSVCSSP